MISIFKDKKGDEFSSLPEIACIFALALGFLFAMTIKSVIISYLVLLIVAFAFGRMCYLYVKECRLQMLLVIVGFIIGFVLGTKNNFQMCFLVFIAGILISYYIHKKELFDLLMK